MEGGGGEAKIATVLPRVREGGCRVVKMTLLCWLVIRGDKRVVKISVVWPGVMGGRRIRGQDSRGAN